MLDYLILQMRNVGPEEDGGLILTERPEVDSTFSGVVKGRQTSSKSRRPGFSSLQLLLFAAF
jgi:hypothetical protein